MEAKMLPLQVRDRILAKMQRGTQELSFLASKGIVILGTAYCGKTALSYYLTDRPLEITENIGRKVFQTPPGKQYRQASINVGFNNAFKPPNVFPLKDSSLVDCFSYQNNNDVEINLLSYFFLQQIFEKMDRIRFVVTISMAGLIEALRTECKTVLKRFLLMFQFDQKFTLEELAKSVVLVVTCCDPNRLSEENILQKLSDLSRTTATEAPNLSRLLQLIYQSRKVLVFKTPPDVGDYRRGEGPEMLNNILRLTTEWSRQSGRVRVPLTNLDFSHIMRVLPADKKALVESFSMELNKWVFNLYELIAKAAARVRQIVIMKPPKEAVFAGWKQTLDAIPSYSKNNIVKLKKTNPPVQFRELKFIEQAWECCKRQADTFTFDTIIAFGTDLLGIMANYLSLTNEELQLVESVAFLLGQKVHQARLVFVKGKENAENIGKELSCSVAATKLGTFRECEYELIELQHVVNMEPQKSTDQNYYVEAKAYINRHIQSHPELLKKLSVIQQIESEAMEGKLPPGKVERMLIESIISNEQHKKQVNRVHYVDCQEKKYKKLGATCFNHRMYEEALEMYRVVNDIEMIESCYNRLTESRPEQAMELYIDKGLYFREQTLFEEAKKAFLQALYHAATPAHKQDISREIIYCSTARGDFEQASISRLENQEYYNRRRHDLAFFYSISDKLAKIPLDLSVSLSEMNVRPALHPNQQLKQSAAQYQPPRLQFQPQSTVRPTIIKPMVPTMHNPTQANNRNPIDESSSLFS